MKFQSTNKESVSQGANNIWLWEDETESATVIDHIGRIFTHFPKIRCVCYIAERE